MTVVAATNRPDMLDPALLRPGRLEVRLELSLPDEAARREIFAIHTRGKPLAADVDLDGLAADSDGLSGADIEAICRRATGMAIRAVLDPSDGAAAGALTVTAADLRAMLAEANQPGSR